MCVSKHRRQRDASVRQIGSGGDPTVVGGAVPGGSVSLAISRMASAGGSAKYANHDQVTGSPHIRYRTWITLLELSASERTPLRARCRRGPRIHHRPISMEIRD